MSKRRQRTHRWQQRFNRNEFGKPQRRPTAPPTDPDKDWQRTAGHHCHEKCGCGKTGYFDDNRKWVFDPPKR